MGDVESVEGRHAVDGNRPRSLGECSRIADIAEATQDDAVGKNPQVDREKRAG